MKKTVLILCAIYLVMLTCSANAETIEVTLADNSKHKFKYSSGMPVKVKNDWVKEVTAAAGLNLHRSQPISASLQWELSFQALVGDLRSIKVFDVTSVPVKLIAQDEHIQLKKGEQWLKYSEPISFMDPSLSWICDHKTTHHFFKFVFENSAGEIRELYQPSLMGYWGKEEVYKLMGTDDLCEKKK